MCVFFDPPPSCGDTIQEIADWMRVVCERTINKMCCCKKSHKLKIFLGKSASGPLVASHRWTAGSATSGLHVAYYLGEHFCYPEADVSMFSGQQILFTYKVHSKIGLLQYNGLINERKSNKMARLSLHVIVITLLKRSRSKYSYVLSTLTFNDANINRKSCNFNFHMCFRTRDLCDGC